VRLRLPFGVRTARVHRPGRDSEDLPVRRGDGHAHFVIPEVGTYAIVELD
jgi:hypothetical protein